METQVQRGTSKMERGLAGESIDVQFFVDRHSREAFKTRNSEVRGVTIDGAGRLMHVIRECEMVVKFQLQIAGMDRKSPMIRQTAAWTGGGSVVIDLSSLLALASTRLKSTENSSKPLKSKAQSGHCAVTVPTRAANARGPRYMLAEEMRQMR